MVNLRYDKKFLKEAKKLPVAQQRKLAQLLALMQQDPFDPRLHTKQLSTPLQGVFSSRIGRDYRLLFRFVDEETLFLTHVKHRREVYR